MSGHQQRGAGKIKAIVTLLALAVFAYAVFQVAPAYMDNYWIQDTMTNEARTAAVTHKNEEEVREVIWKVVREREIKATPAVKREDIRVEYTGRAVNIGLKYTVVVNLYFYQFSLNFTPSAGDRPII